MSYTSRDYYAYGGYWNIQTSDPYSDINVSITRTSGSWTPLMGDLVVYTGTGREVERFSGVEVSRGVWTHRTFYGYGRYGQYLQVVFEPKYTWASGWASIGTTPIPSYMFWR